MARLPNNSYALIYGALRRLARAVDALSHGTMSVARIARETGFKSAPGFSNAFKKHYGMSPNEFRSRSRHRRDRR